MQKNKVQRQEGQLTSQHTKALPPAASPGCAMYTDHWELRAAQRGYGKMSQSATYLK
jgi:hypothetical protein